MKRQKLDLEKTIETFKKSLCEEKIASAQQNGRDHVTKAESLLRCSRRRRCCAMDFRLRGKIAE